MSRFSISHLHRRVVCLLLLASALAPALWAQPTIIATTSSDIGPLVRTEWTVGVSPNPINTFRMTRLARDVPPEHLKGSMLFLPSLGTSFTLY